MNKKYKVNKKKCVGCGICVSKCPEVFAIQDGKSSIKENADFAANEGSAAKAHDSCPAGAIEIVDENE